MKRSPSALALCLTLAGMSSFSFAQDTLPAADKPAMNRELTAQEDSLINAAIESHIKNSTTLKDNALKVYTTKGVVHLSGMVDVDSQAASIVEFAQSVNGVKDVDLEKLTVKGSVHPLSDMWITAKIKGLLIREDIFGTKDIASLGMSIETKNGVVYLSGTVENKAQINNAIILIKGVKGVRKVEYSLKKVTPAVEQNSGS